MSLLEIRGVTGGLLDDPFDLTVRGVEAGEDVLWRARYRDDDMRVWLAAAAGASDLSSAWRPSKPSTGPVAALQSLRPVRIDVRVEAGGRAAARSLTRELLSEGVRVRRWAGARLFLPAESCATVLVESADSIAPALLASRGVLVLAVASGSVDEARERLAAVPGSADPITIEPVVPPNVGGSTEADAAAWDALIARLGARPR
jgi:hypothetical protein